MLLALNRLQVKQNPGTRRFPFSDTARFAIHIAYQAIFNGQDEPPQRQEPTRPPAAPQAQERPERPTPPEAPDLGPGIDSVDLGKSRR